MDLKIGEHSQSKKGVNVRGVGDVGGVVVVE